MQPFLSGRCPFFRALQLGIKLFTLFCVIPLWDSSTTHSPSGKELNPSSQEDAHFSGSCTLAYNFYFICLIPLWGLATSHPTVESSTLPPEKMPVFQIAAPWHANFTLSCVIPLWDSAMAHSPSGKGLNHSYQEDARFSGCCTLVNKFYFILRHTFLSFLSSSLCLWSSHVSQGSLVCNVLKLFCLGSPCRRTVVI